MRSRWGGYGGGDRSVGGCFNHYSFDASMPGDVEVSIVPFIEIFSTFQKLRTIFFLFSIVEDGHANRKRLVLRCMDTFRVVYLARSQELWQGSVPWAPLLPWNKGHRPICHPTCGHISVITWRLLTYTL